MKNNRNILAFTLVELIVSIVILAILGTIGFISISSYSKISRDSARISDIGKIKTGLELFMIDSGKYPLPTNGVDITYLSGTVWTQGAYGEQTNKNVDKLSKLPTDPLTESKYTYSVTSRGNEYEISGIVEGDEVGMSRIMTQTNAGETIVKAIVTGTYNGQITKTTDGTLCSLLAVPTIIVSDTTEYTDLEELSANKKFVYNGYNNLPSSYNGSKFNNNAGFDFEPNQLLIYNDYLGCKTLQDNETERIIVLKKLQESYSGTLLETEGNYKELMDVNIDLFGPNNTSKLISRSIMTNNLGLRLSEDSITYLNCEIGEVNGYSYENIAHSLGKNVTKTGIISYGIQNYGAQAICDNGVVTIQNESINTICNTGYVEQAGQCVEDICNGTIPTNGVSTATSQSVNTTWIYNSTIPGQCTFKCDTNYVYNNATNTCNAGTQNTNCTLLPTNAQWNTTNNITQTWNGTSWLPLEIGSYNTTASTTECNFKCDTNYTWNGSECIADTQIATCGGSVKTNATATTTNTYTQTWNGTAWTPITNWGENQSTCDFDCNINYTWNSSTSQCEANSQTGQACTGKPANTVYNTATSITQTWNGTTWLPSTTSTYNITPSTTSCNFKCDTNYTWNTTMCEADTQSTTCGGSIPTNATATTPTTYTQTWNGTIWTPTTSWGEFQATCDFNCNTGYTWNGTSCTLNTYTVSGSFGANANGATINVCGTNVTADASGNFTATRNHGSTCNAITATRTGYTCSTTTNGPASLTSNFTTVVGSCTINGQSCTVSNGSGTQYWTGTSWSTCEVDSCNTDYYKTSTSVCTAVGTGYYSANGSITRTACSNYPDTTSRDYTYTSSGNGTNSCAASYTQLCGVDLYESGTSCISVGTGYYSPSANNTRYSCSNYPDTTSRDYTYTSSGNGSNSCTASYTAKCGIDLYETSNGVCSAVGIGYYSPSANNSRYSCTNTKTISTMVYTTSGNGSNNCSFACPSGYSYNTTHTACVMLTPKLTLTQANCDSTAVVQGRYKTYATRCGEQSGIDYWNNVRTTQGDTQARTLFMESVTTNAGSIPPTQAWLNGFLCNTGDTYIKNTIYCKK